MGILNNLREEYILRPLADHLIKRNQESQAKAQVGPAILRGQVDRANSWARGKKPGAGVSFPALRRFSTQYDVARACINRRKRQINQLEWDIVLKETDGNKKADAAKVREIKSRIRAMGGYGVRFRTLLDLITEDLMVLDAVAMEKIYTNGKEFYGVHVVDGASIKLKVTGSGMRPMPPETAFEQWVGGTKVAEWNAEEMYYEMMNPRSSTPYGLSPIESLVLGISAALKSEIYNVNLLSEGNIPEGFFGVPESWSPDDIKQYQQTFDAIMAGNTRETSKIQFMPDGKYTPTKKPEDMRYKELQDWLMRKTCMLFEVQPQELGFVENVNRSNGEVQSDIQTNTGLRPLAGFFEDLFEDIITKDMGYDGYRLSFIGLEQTDEKEDAEVAEIRIRSGFSTVDEERALKGRKALGVDKPFVTSQPHFIDPESLEEKRQMAEQIQDTTQTDTQPAEDDPEEEPTTDTEKSADERHVELISDLRAFRKYALGRISKGKKISRPFESSVLPAQDVAELNKRLSTAGDREEVREIFSEYMKDYQVKFLEDAIELKRSLKKVTHE